VAAPNHSNSQGFSAPEFGMVRALVNGGADMFKISTIDTNRERRLVVEGTLVQPWVGELRRSWSDARNSLDGRTLVIDLANTTVISREAESAILELMKEGAQFSCRGVLTRHLIKQLAHRCNTNLNRVLNRRRSEDDDESDSLRRQF
jgi:hypothetical protein